MEEAAFGVAICATNVSLQRVEVGWLPGCCRLKFTSVIPTLCFQVQFFFGLGS